MEPLSTEDIEKHVKWLEVIEPDERLIVVETDIYLDTFEEKT